MVWDNLGLLSHSLVKILERGLFPFDEHIMNVNLWEFGNACRTAQFLCW